MAEGLAEPSPKSPAVDVASTVAAAVAPADPLLGKRIEFHLERKPYSPVSSSRDFHLETLNPSKSQPQMTPAMGAVGPASAAGQHSGRKSDGGLDPVLNFRVTFRRIGAGLQNLGNTCFLNSVLQCLTYTEPFAAYCHTGEHKSSCRTAGFCAMCALQNHVMNALQSTGKILSPFHLVKNLRCISRNFRNSRQEDAHEYMVNLLESMHKCCLPSGVPTESPSAYERSLVHKIFGGRLRSQVRCTQCNYCSNTFDPFLDLSLEIFKADSLKRALAHFTAREQLDGGERQYQCQRCKEKVRAYKQLTIHKAPYVLTIHLKRFGPHIPGQKINKKVDFEPILDLRPFVSDQQEADLKYTLYGVLVHAGWSTHSGHYYCFVRTSSGMWHSLDDNQVKAVSEKTVLAQKAYMLFYVRDSSAIKKSADVVRKGNMLANAPSSKVILQPASTLNGATTERKSSFSECGSAKSKVDDTFHSQTISMVGNSSGELLATEASSMMKNGNAIQKASCLQANSEVLSNGLQLTTPSRDSTKLKNPSTDRPRVITSSHNQKETKDVAHPFQLKENGGITTSHVNAASDTCEREKVQEKSGLHDGCNGEVGSSIVAAQPINSGLLNLQKHSKNLLRRNNQYNEGITNGFSQNIPCSTDVVRASDKELKSFCSKLTCANGYTGKKDIKRIPGEHQKIVREYDKCMANLQCAQRGESLLKVEESELNTSEKNLSYANGCIQPEAVAVTNRESSVGKCFQMEQKRKKHGRPFLKGQYFGRKQLFLESLFLHKKMKHKRSKKHLINSKKLAKARVIEDLCSGDLGGMHTDDLGLSTTETIKLVDVASAGSSKKHSWSSPNRGKSVQAVEDRKYYTGDYVHSRNPDRSSKNEIMLATPHQSRCPQNSTENMCNGREADACCKGPDQKGVTSLLMTLKQTTVPRWDGIELPISQSRDLGNVQSTRYDEWDEEYDRGRRKKVKKSHRSFGGPNPFQEIANMKVQQQNMKVKVNHSSSENQPFRI